ncbi:MAG: VOC family protein [Nocardioides sp.]|nr:VOC family protein [Nocardioides sp.]
MDVLSSRILLHPSDLAASKRFYGETLGLAVAREFGDPDNLSCAYFLGSGLLELSGPGGGEVGPDVAVWLQVRDVEAEHQRLRPAGVDVLRAPKQEPWGLVEMWIADPDGVRIVLVEIPEDHPLRRDQR